MDAGIGFQFEGTVWLQVTSRASRSCALDKSCKISSSVVYCGGFEESASHSRRRFRRPEVAITNCSPAVWEVGADNGQTLGVGTIGWPNTIEVRICEIPMLAKYKFLANIKTYNFILNSVRQYLRVRRVQLLRSAIDQRDCAT